MWIPIRFAAAACARSIGDEVARALLPSWRDAAHWTGLIPRQGDPFVIPVVGTLVSALVSGDEATPLPDCDAARGPPRQPSSPHPTRRPEIRSLSPLR